MAKNKSNDTTILVPGPTDWELWRASPSGGFVLEHSVPALGEDAGSPASFKSATILGIPAAGAFSVPLWVATDDPALVQNVRDIQLETLGLKPDAVAGQHVDDKVVTVEEKRTLLRVTVLAKRFDLPLPKQHPTQYEVSPNLYFLPENALTVWKEFGKLVFAVTRAEHAIYFQNLTTGTLDANAAHEIAMAVMPLRSQNVVTSLEGATLWLDEKDALPDGREILGELLACPVTYGPRPAPATPFARSALLPESVAVARIHARKAARIRNLSLAAAAVLFLAAAYLVADYLIQQRRVDELQASVDQLEPLAGWIPGMEAKWADMQKAIDAETYPVETLLRVYELLPSQGVRFTNVSITNARVTILGEAQDQRAAIRYQNAISADDNLDHFQWEQSPTRINQRTKTAEFTLTGKPLDAPADI
ncbi:hypothetical protein BH23VER1_BH23VER1_32270 [soil metagenome]